MFYFVFEGNFQVQAPEGLYSEGRLNGGLFCVTSLFICRGLNMEGLTFEIFPFICNMLTALIEMRFQCYLPYLIGVCENHFCFPKTVSTSSVGFFSQVR